MASQHIKSRIVHKHDTESNWLKATNFIPMKGEIIVYDVDENYNYERMKIGDGITVVSSLQFVIDTITDNTIDDICNGQSIISAEEVMY